MHELEIAAEGAVAAQFGEDGLKARGHCDVCANCDALLHGRYCHSCGQNADRHRRSIFHLAWEAVEGLLHLDGRLLRTLPDLFVRPGRLARDYMQGRIARHVPPFRTFLVALLIYVFAAEHASHEARAASEAQARARIVALKTPAGRARIAAGDRLEAAKDRDADLKDAAKDRDDDLRDPDENRAKVEDRYAGEMAQVNARYAAAMAEADRLAQGGLPEAATLITPRNASSDVKSGNWFKDNARRAAANPDYYLTVMFAWGHRLAVLLLPIIGLSLALVYRKRRDIFIYDHLLVAMNVLSFSFLTNAAALMVPPPLVWWALIGVALWMPINLFQTLRGAYGSSVVATVLKTIVVWSISIVSFFLLLVGVFLVALAEL